MRKLIVVKPFDVVRRYGRAMAGVWAVSPLGVHFGIDGDVESGWHYVAKRQMWRYGYSDNWLFLPEFDAVRDVDYDTDGNLRVSVPAGWRVRVYKQSDLGLLVRTGELWYD